MENNEVKPKRQRKINPDRIVLEQDTLAVIKKVTEQIENTFGGVVKLTNKEIANFLIQSRNDELSAPELSAIKDKFFDDVRAAQWAVNRLKAAKVAGQQVSLADVLNELQMPVVMEKRAPRKAKAKKEKQETSGDISSDQTNVSKANGAT